MSFLGYAALLLCWIHCAAQRGEAGRCGRPPAIQNGDFLGLAKKKYQQGDTVEYQCQNFYTLEGSRTITCSNGQWTSPPVCLVPCTASEEDMDRNNIQLRWDPTKTKLYTTSGDFIEFDCKLGYIKDPSTPNFRVQCVEGTLEYPRCTRGMFCRTSEEDMDRNNIQLKWDPTKTELYSTSGDSIEFDCKRGYIKDPSTPNFRVQCVEGTLEYPRCTRGRSCALDRNTMERNHIQLHPSSPLSPSYNSGDPIYFACKPWSWQVSESSRFRARCLDGVITYPECQAMWFF